MFVWVSSLETMAAILHSDVLAINQARCYIGVAKRYVWLPTVEEAMKPRASIQVNIRLAPTMKERLAERARANFRSLNAEIERRLSESLTAVEYEKAQHA